jgi:hypothetical protein
MKTAILKTTTLAAALLLAVPVGGAQAQPANWFTMKLTANIAKPAQAAWKLVGGEDWCGIAKYLDVKSCHIDKGTGDVGSLRTINGTILEIAVARTPLSYTYAQPAAANFYHGTMAVEPVDATHSRLTYTLIWNQTAVGDAKAQAEARNSRRSRFQAAVNKMAAHANAAK